MEAVSCAILVLCIASNTHTSEESGFTDADRKKVSMDWKKLQSNAQALKNDIDEAIANFPKAKSDTPSGSADLSSLYSLWNMVEIPLNADLDWYLSEEGILTSSDRVAVTSAQQFWSK